MATIVIEQCKISPAPDAAATEFYLPLVFFDMMWYGMPANEHVLFYEFKSASCSKSDFLESIVPDLKRSLSETLTHFLPLAGNIIHPLDLTGSDKRPVIRYVAGNSVSFTVSESKADFSHLSGHHPKDSNEFYALVPNLPGSEQQHDSIACPVLAVQATLFPGKGVCIGFVWHHIVGDASTAASFMQAWGLIHKHNYTAGCASDMLHKYLPFYDRQSTDVLDTIYWNRVVKKSLLVEPPRRVEFPAGKFRTMTFVLRKDEIQRLKEYYYSYAVDCRDNRVMPSSFIIVCALVWICLARSAAAGGEVVADDESECFTFLADCRGRLNPSLPANYFGNCLAPVVVELRHEDLKKGDKAGTGFVLAIELIGKAIQDRVYDEKGVLHHADGLWLEENEKLAGKRVYAVAGSPRFDFYAVDYGWGKPKKFKILSVDMDKIMSLSKSREFEGGVEIGLSKPKLQMDAFTEVYTQVLADLIG